MVWNRILSAALVSYVGVSLFPFTMRPANWSRTRADPLILPSRSISFRRAFGSRQSYSIFIASARIPHKQLIVVEGFFDCVRVHQAGFSNVVALMGCTMSREQTKLLCAVCSRAVLFLDGDPAGRQAVSAISSTLEAQGLEVREVCLPDGRQPDSMQTHDIQRLLGTSSECKYIEEEAGP